MLYLDRVLNGEDTETGKSVERLSGGRVLLTDDPAGYAVDQALEKFIRGLDRMIANREDMLSYDTVEDAMLGTIVDTLQRIRDLAGRMGDGILADDDRAAIQAEIDQEYDQVLFTLNTAEFNTKRIFGDIAQSPLVRQVLADPRHADPGNVDRLLGFFIAERAAVGAQAEALRFSLQGDSAASVNMTAARQSTDTEFGAEMASFRRHQLLVLVNLLMLKQGLQ